MKNTVGFRRLVFTISAAILVAGILVGTRIGSRPVAAQAGPAIDVFMFQCSVIPNQPDFFALGSYHFTGTGAPGAVVINSTDCAGVMAQVLNAGYHLKSEL